MLISNSTNKLHPHFQEREFFSKSLDFSDTSHFLDDRVIFAVFFLREHYNCPIQINSTHRTKAANLFDGGHPRSKHLSGEAIDFAFADGDIRSQFYYDMQDERNSVFLKLRQLGISAFGLYDTFVHIDCGDYEKSSGSSYRRDMYGKWKKWDNTSKKKDFFQQLTKATV